MLSDQDHLPKRRKVRKGTQSCWECKRRKVRCIFASAGHAVCNNCRRRGTACVSQELPDVPSTSYGQSQVDARLGRVEELVERLVNARSGPSLDREELNAGSPVHRAVPSRPPTRTRPPSVSDRYEELSRALLAAWPSEGDLETIGSLPVSLYLPLRWRTYTLSRDQSPREILQLPPPDAHPVLIARKLLMLGTFLQGVSPSAIQQLGDRGVSYRETMTRAVERAVTLVTTNDELIGSVEGLECVMLETMYQNYAGNLHRAWMAVKRATSAAQMMGLHRARDLPPSRFLDPATRAAAFDADNICFRLVQMDHYLSLMLGLPQTAPEGRFAIPQDLSRFDPGDRLERLHCAVSGRIVQRNDAGINDLSITCEADKLLQTAAAEMPPQWWLTPTFSKDSDLVADTIRLMDQFTHHHLLARLHLPYMLRSSASTEHDHNRSKAIAVNASRELLSRYILFRSANPVDYYCRGCDFLAFVATTILCLAHINTSARPNSDNANNFDPLTHSRPTDRGIMERTAEIIASTATAEYSASEAIAPKLTRIIRHLLDVESNAASGAIYSTSSSPSDGEEGEIGGTLSQGGKALQIRIPYFGTIRLERGHGIPITLQAEVQGQVAVADSYGMVGAHADEPVSSSWGAGHDIRTSHLQAPASNGPWGFESQPDSMYSGAEDNWDLQGIDIALFDSLFRGIEIPDADTSGEACI